MPFLVSQVCTDLCTIWHWALSEKLNLSLQERRTMSAVLVLSETLQPREAKELVTIVLKDLQFESVIVHQESLAALFGNNMTSACIVSLGAQVCSVACIEVRERGRSLFLRFRFFSRNHCANCFLPSSFSVLLDWFGSGSL